MIDRLVKFDFAEVESLMTVTADNILVEDGLLTAPGLIENVAQTCAARIGYINYINNRAVKLGFIGAICDFRIHALPRVGDTLETRVTVREEVFGLTLVDAVVACDGRTLAETEMKIALSDIDSQKGGDK